MQQYDFMNVFFWQAYCSYCIRIIINFINGTNFVEDERMVSLQWTMNAFIYASITVTAVFLFSCLAIGKLSDEKREAIFSRKKI